MTAAATPAAPKAVWLRSLPMRWHLGLYALALLLPTLGFVGVVLWQYAMGERTRLEREALDTARSIANVIDRELAGLRAAIDTLATSAYLRAGDIPGFYNQSREIEQRLGLIMVLRDPTGQQLANARVPLGTPLPRVVLPVDAEAVRSGRPEVSNLFTGAVSPEPLFTLVAPVTRDGALAYYLSASIPVARIRQIIVDEHPPELMTVAVIDRAGIILARSSRHEEFVGRPATRDLQDNTTGRDGTWNGSTADGSAVFGAYARSRVSDWRVAVGLRFSDLNAPVLQSLLLLATLGLALGLLSAVLAFAFGHRIAAPIQALTRQAMALGRGMDTEPLHSPVREADQVSRELTASGERLRQRERERDQAAADLIEANEEIQRYAYIVSHDLRAPLVNVMGFTSEIEATREDLRAALAGRPEAEALDRDLGESLGFIKAAVNKMDRLINAILRISREGRRAFRPEPLDMTALVQGLADAQRHQADQAGARVVVSPLPRLTCDRLAVEQIFGNLVDNAVKYLAPGRPGRIEISGRKAAGRVLYTVRDNGRGIAAQDHQRVFELFRRAGTQDRPGEGIGLAHVRALVRALGGRIDLASQLGAGTTFTVDLPERPAGAGPGRADQGSVTPPRGGKE